MTPADASTPEPVVALLRAVNVGGTGKLAMADLRSAAESLGHTAVATYLNSGNLVLVPADGSPAPTSGLADTLATTLADKLGRPLPLTLRTRSELDDIVARNPHAAVAEDDPSRLLVVFFDDPVGAPTLDTARYGPEDVVWSGSEAYIHYPDGVGRSRLTGDVLARAVGGPGTGRNWRTVLALQHLLHDRSSDAPDTATSAAR